MSDVIISLLQLFSASGSDIRMFYTTIDSEQKLQYIAVSPAVNASTSAKVWFIGKLYYNGDGCMSRFIKLSTQQILDDKADFFP